ncbi:MAG: ABC transporter ATP-binding protein, partial [Proteobacteria bacterium]|nr:ABC transporter ATP-binding protein [Pseudomonadota bacterium]
MQPTIIFDHVSKKFSRTYVSDSLRDTLTAPFKKLFGRNGESDKENKEFWALEDVSFEVKPGEVLGIIGSNGSGKTTTLKLLSRILRPDGGRIMVNGRIGALI